MRPGQNGIVELVRAATVVITAADATGTRVPVGSGFFVAPGWVLTCAHVVKKGARPRVLWRGRELEPTTVRVRPEAARPDGSFGWPDAAALEVKVPEDEPAAPCVPVATEPPAPGREVWAYGISRIRGGTPERDGSVLTVANPVPDDEPGFLKLQQGQLAPGMSGGPVLDLGGATPCRMPTGSTSTPTATGGPPTRYRRPSWSPRAGCCPASSTRTPTPAPRNPASRWTRTCCATTSAPTWRPGSR